MVWDITTPLGSESKSQGDDRIRELKTDIQTALRAGEDEGDVAVFPGDDTSNPVFEYRGRRGATADRPTAGNSGLFFDEERNTLQRDNGTSWDDIGTNFPTGTVIPFCQAAAPIGWTKLTTQNDKALRVVSGSGGGAGGSVAFSTDLAHSHTVNSHTHDLANHTHSTPAHTHSLAETSDAGSGGAVGAKIRSSGGKLVVAGAVGSANVITPDTSSGGSGTSGAPSSNTSGATAPGTDSQLGAFAYVDVILASKD